MATIGKEARDRSILAVIAVMIGGFALLEGTGLTQYGEMTNNTPSWILATVGTMFLVVAFMIMFGSQLGYFNDLCACVLMTLMASVFWWVSLYGEEDGFSGNGEMIAGLTGLPIGRVMFGVGATMISLGALIAFSMFCRKLLNK